MMRLRWGVFPGLRLPTFLSGLPSLGRLRKLLWKKRNGSGKSESSGSESGAESGSGGRRSGVESGAESGPEHYASSSTTAPSSSYPTSNGTSTISQTWTPSWRTFLAETCFFYSQATPTVALLLPRAFLTLVVLISYSSPKPNDVLSASSSSSGVGRDGTFFRSDGALSGYGKGVLWAMLGIAAFRAAVWVTSW